MDDNNCLTIKAYNSEEFKDSFGIKNNGIILNRHVRKYLEIILIILAPFTSKIIVEVKYLKFPKNANLVEAP